MPLGDKVIAVVLEAVTGKYKAEMASAAASTKSFGTAASGVASSNAAMDRSMGRSAASTGRFGTVLGRVNPGLVGAAGLAAGLAASAKAAIDWESAFAGVTKTVEGTPRQLQQISDGLRAMSREIPTSAAELAGIAESAGQLGIETPNVLEFTRTIADLGETTNLVGQEGATALARFANITGMAQTDFDRLGSTIVALGNNFATTEAEIVEMSLRLAGAGSQVGMTEDQILAFATALSSVGIAAEAGGTAFSRVMVEIEQSVAQTDERLQTFASVAGMSAQQFAAAWQSDPAAAMQAFITGLGNVEAAGGNVFQVLEALQLQDVRVRDSLLRSAGAADQMTGALDLAAGAWEENTALTDEAAQRYDTAAAKISGLGNELKDLAVTFGEELAPAVGEAAEVMGNFVGAINEVADDRGGILGFIQDALPGGFVRATEEVERNITVMDGWKSVTGQAAEAAERSVGASGAAGDAIGELGDEAADAADEIDDMRDAFDKMIDKAFGIQQASDDFHQSLSDLRKQVRGAVKDGDEHARSLTGQTDAARANRRAMVDVIDTAKTHIVSLIEQGRSTDKVRAAIDNQEAALRRTARQLGLNDKETEQYIAELRRVPDDVRTKINLDAADANARLREIKRQIDLIPRDISTRVHVSYIDPRSGSRVGSGVTMHDGGIVQRAHAGAFAGPGGLLSDEVPAILQTGERVLSRAQNRQFERLLGALSSQGSAGVSIGTVQTLNVAEFESQLDRWWRRRQLASRV